MTKQDDHAGSPAPSEPVAEWQWRQWWNGDGGEPQGWGEWQRVKSRRLQTLDEAVREFRDFIAQGCRYELRPLYTHPAHAAESSKAALSDEEIQKLAKERYRGAIHTELSGKVELWPEQYRAMQRMAFMDGARAILARAGITRKPLDRAGIERLWNEARNEPGCTFAIDWFNAGIRLAERAHGITPQAGKESGE